MTRTTVLAILPRVFGVTGLFALVAVLMPISWMAGIHRWLGLDQMPSGPVVEYLARSLSVFYVLFSVLCLVLAGNLERYRPLVRLLGALAALMGVALVYIDLAAGMPARWTVCEGPGEIAFGGLIFFLARQDR